MIRRILMEGTNINLEKILREKGITLKELIMKSGEKRFSDYFPRIM